MLDFYKEPIIQKINDPLLTQKGVHLFMKREDLIHPYVSGNKWRKLKYNLMEAREKGFNKLLTFGGAYSNHIYATAAAARETGFQSIGIIRGEELENQPLNTTLSFARGQGMNLKFVSREVYREKTTPEFIEKLRNQYGDFYLLPEGGTNMLAIKGCSEILTNETDQFDFICSSVGTGGTLSGLVISAKQSQKVIGFSTLKGGFLTAEVGQLLDNYSGRRFGNWEIMDDYHFGGYAKKNSFLTDFVKDFESTHSTLLDPIYTSKMMFGIYDMVKKDLFKTGSAILAIHTGGLQGRTLD